jgi:hypothetical protein
MMVDDPKYVIDVEKTNKAREFARHLIEVTETDIREGHCLAIVVGIVGIDGGLTRIVQSRGPIVDASGQILAPGHLRDAVVAADLLHVHAQRLWEYTSDQQPASFNPLPGGPVEGAN